MSAGADATLPRSARLLRREQYTAALTSGTSRSRRHVSLACRPNGLSHARIGIVAGKRIAPRAVDRNRVKRIVRETFRKARHQLAGWDIVIQLRRAPASTGYARLAAEVGKLLEELKNPPHGA